VSRIQHLTNSFSFIHSFIGTWLILLFIHPVVGGKQSVATNEEAFLATPYPPKSICLFIFIIIESKFALDDEDEEHLAHFSPLLILQSVCEITTETTSTHLRSCLLGIPSADLFEDFHRNIYGFGEIFVCSHFSSAYSFQDLTETYGIKLWDLCLLENFFCGLFR